jgi:hypothetical protein
MPAPIMRVSSTVVLTVILVACAAGPSASDKPTPSAAAMIPTATLPRADQTALPASPRLSATRPPSPQPTSVPEPTKPAGVSFREELPASNEGEAGEFSQTVTWRAPRTEGVEIRVYGVTECIAEPPDPAPDTSGPCLVEHTALPASVRTLLATAPASDGAVRWTWMDVPPDCGTGDLAFDPDGPRYHAVVLAAYNTSGHSIFAIAEPGRWWRPALNDIIC